MEFWVVAAATGAGYVAKHWKNLSGNKDGQKRVKQDACQLFDKMPLPKLTTKCLLNKDGSFSEEEYNKIGMNLDDHTYETNKKDKHFDSYDHRLHEFRTNRNAFSSPRPLVVTGKSKQTKRVGLKDRKIVFIEENEELYEPSGSVKLPKRPEQMYVKKFETRDLHSQENDMVTLFLGITIGILSTTINNQQEIEHLNELLELAENMVQDLHNKIELKQGFTGGISTDSPKVDDKFELTSEIEAELEAELERLEQNIKCNVVEIDSDIEADIARGDLNLDSLTWQLDSQSESDHEVKRAKSQTTEQPVSTPNYTVSSLELRLRLHEIIESQLRARIDELEAVLENQNSQIQSQSQSKTHSPKPQEEEDDSFWDFDHTRIESFSSTP